MSLKLCFCFLRVFFKGFKSFRVFWRGDVVGFRGVVGYRFKRLVSGI